MYSETRLLIHETIDKMLSSAIINDRSDKVLQLGKLFVFNSQDSIFRATGDFGRLV